MAHSDYSKDKYLTLAKKHGLQVAINQLHQDLWQLELLCFETPDGYQADMWKTLNDMRIFSRELWDVKLEQI